MHKNFYLNPLTLAISLSLTSLAHAAVPVALDKVNFVALQKEFHLALSKQKMKNSIATDTLFFLSEHTDSNTITHVRLQQQYSGFPVFGGYAIVHSPQKASGLIASAANASMNGTVYRGLSQELGSPNSNFVADGAKALSHFKTQINKKNISEGKVMPMVYVDNHNKAHWAYQVSVMVQDDNQMPELPTAIIDAHTFKPYVQWNDLKTEMASVNGMGYGGNPKIGEYVYGRDLPLLELRRNNETQTCYMENNSVRIVDMKHSNRGPNIPMQFSCKDDKNLGNNTYWTGSNSDGYDKENGAASPSNDALYAGYIIKHLYLEWYGLEVLKNLDGTPMKLIMRVHYGQDHANASWSNNMMTYGDGNSNLYPLVSLGIAAHEISHGFTEQHSGLMYYGQSGGINESFSDMAAITVDYYTVGHSSWKIGAEVMKEGSGREAVRFMDKPSRDGSSIDAASQYSLGLDVHYSSGVYNRLFYTLANQPGWNIKKAFEVMIKANVDYWTPYTKFVDGACGILNATKDLNYADNEVKYALDQVAIDYRTCLKSA